MRKSRRVNLEFVTTKPGVLPRWPWPAVGAEQRSARGRGNLRIRSDLTSRASTLSSHPRASPRRLYKLASHGLLLRPSHHTCYLHLPFLLLAAASSFGLWVFLEQEEDGGRGHGELHRHHPRHHPAAARRLLQVRLRDRVLDLLAAHLLRLPPRHHLRRLGHHQVEGALPPPALPQVMAISFGALDCMFLPPCDVHVCVCPCCTSDYVFVCSCSATYLVLSPPV